MTGSAKQSSLRRGEAKVWIASSQELPAMTELMFASNPACHRKSDVPLAFLPMIWRGKFIK
jgi:hypothetical protein